MADGCLLIDRGDLASLVALALEPDRGRIVIWPVIDRPGQRRAVDEHADAYGIRKLLRQRPFEGDARVDQRQARQSLRDSLVLLEGAALAMEHDCSKLIWPAQVGDDLSRIGDEVARMQLVSSLCELDDSRRDLTGWIADPHRSAAALAIEVPVVDLSDAELVDLADDTGAPLRAFWPCAGTGDQQAEPCGRCVGCNRWQAAFAAARVPWPWTVVPA
jgi:hypothetical protein